MTSSPHVALDKTSGNTHCREHFSLAKEAGAVKHMLKFFFDQDTVRWRNRTRVYL
ncbi:uncharacterized protein FOMMEDRAFT_19909, partial [Fomitiporia mediterranea MF3/22]|uniref:uncharacterized protein n=1 Tax=Fomitiporia mediterranea (strain MF3/22) TaxID=694068 RepID=UPI00044073EE